MFLQSEAVFFRLHHHLDISFLISPKLLYVVCFCLCDVFLSPNSFKLLSCLLCLEPKFKPDDITHLSQLHAIFFLNICIFTAMTGAVRYM